MLLQGWKKKTKLCANQKRLDPAIFPYFPICLVRNCLQHTISILFIQLAWVCDVDFLTTAIKRAAREKNRQTQLALNRTTLFSCKRNSICLFCSRINLRSNLCVWCKGRLKASWFLWNENVWGNVGRKICKQSVSFMYKKESFKLFDCLSQRH